MSKPRYSQVRKKRDKEEEEKRKNEEKSRGKGGRQEDLLGAPTFPQQNLGALPGAQPYLP